MHTFVHAIRRAVTIAADHEALVCGDVRLTYRQLASRLERLHTVIAGLGTEPGDRVAILSFNSIGFTELYCAVPMAGRVQVPLNFRWADPELAYALEDSGARVLFCDRDPGELADLVDTVVRIDTDDYEQRLATADPTPFDVDAVAEDDLAGLFYTGGTTGQSKGVMLSHRNLLANAFSMQTIQPLHGDDRYLVMAPMFHAAGSVSLLQSIFVGATQVLMPAFSPGEMLDLVERRGHHPDTRGTDDGGRRRRGAAGAPARRRQLRGVRPRRVADRTRGRAPRHRGVPGHGVPPPVRRDRDLADRQRPARRGRAPRPRAGEVGRTGRDGGRSRHP